jgi:drug/metabolite transporter (DMT)-like permease
MATRSLHSFESKLREAAAGSHPYAEPMIDRTMHGGEWGRLLLLSVIWGGAFFFIEIAVREVATLTFVWLRLSIAAAALWAFLWLRGDLPRLPAGALGALAVLALLNNVVPFALFAWAQTHIESGLASILNATSPIWTVIVAHFLTRDEGITPARFVGVLLGLGGVALMIGPDMLTRLGDQLLAQLACVAGAFCYALAGVWARRFKAMGVTPTSVAAWQLAAAALIMLPLALIVDQPWTATMPSLAAWSAIFALALICSAFAYILYFQVIERAGATNALLVTLLVPPTAILLGSLFLNEQLAPQDFAGLALIALGLAAIDGRLLSRLRPASPRPAA